MVCLSIEADNRAIQRSSFIYLNFRTPCSEADPPEEHPVIYLQVEDQRLCLEERDSLSEDASSLVFESQSNH